MAGDKSWIKAAKLLHDEGGGSGPTRLCFHALRGGGGRDNHAP